MEAILASMAAATGNAAPAAGVRRVDEPTDKPRAASSGLKRAREGDAEGDVDIWNPRVEQEVAGEWLTASASSASAAKVTPAAEIARQQTVRQLCVRIRRAGEELGIAKLPNAAYESWQLSARLTAGEADPLLPHAESDYGGLLEELVKAGAPNPAARKACKALAKEADRLLRKFRQLDAGGSQRRHVRLARDGDGFSRVTYGKADVRLTDAHLAKLRTMFTRRREGGGDGSSDGERLTPQDERDFQSALFCLLLRYDSLDGGGFQAALNEECFDALLEHFDCKMECFASPLNSRYARFCSAFEDTDRAFGSVGSFFDFSPRAGCFEANPPFIPKVIKRMAEHMTALLERADGPLAFIVIIPAWQETEGWQQLYKSRYNQKHVRIAQKEHGYCEGKQQIRKTRWRIASFDTSVFFWQNARAQTKWPVTDRAIADLKRAFQSKQAEERDAKGLRHSGKRVKAAAQKTSSSKSTITK